MSISFQKHSVLMTDLKCRIKSALPYWSKLTICILISIQRSNNISPMAVHSLLRSSTTAARIMLVRFRQAKHSNFEIRFTIIMDQLSREGVVYRVAIIGQTSDDSSTITISLCSQTVRIISLINQRLKYHPLSFWSVLAGNNIIRSPIYFYEQQSKLKLKSLADPQWYLPIFLFRVSRSNSRHSFAKPHTAAHVVRGQHISIKVGKQFKRWHNLHSRFFSLHQNADLRLLSSETE